jgi:hypothetical protein
VSIREASSSERELAQRNKDAVDRAVAALMVMLALLKTDLRHIHSETSAAIRLALFETELTQLITSQTAALNTTMRAALYDLYGLKSGQDGDFMRISEFGVGSAQSASGKSRCAPCGLENGQTADFVYVFKLGVAAAE